MSDIDQMGEYLMLSFDEALEFANLLLKDHISTSPSHISHCFLAFENEFLVEASLFLLNRPDLKAFYSTICFKVQDNQELMDVILLTKSYDNPHSPIDIEVYNSPVNYKISPQELAPFLNNAKGYIKVRKECSEEVIDRINSFIYLTS